MDERPKLNMINVITRDMDASLAFYELLGVDVSGADPWRVDGVGHHVEAASFGDLSLDMDSTALAAQYDESRRDGGGPACCIGFQVATRAAVDDVHATLVAAGHASRQAPYDAFWGARYAVVADPDGNSVGIMSPRDPSLGGPPPEV